MKLIDLIEPLKSLDTTKQLSERALPGMDYEQCGIYLAKELTPESEVKLVDYEEVIHNKIIIDDVVYVELLPLSMAQEMAMGLASVPGEYPDNKAIAERLILYSVNDA